ncbi:SRPBCC domain-containing protein [Rhizohabitans arisaemae]|uniref:SRPBCC domain-containing protein n=1 Tax=Rhizohabitans arisaemae TaxID=2720610 RepID=UPI0024B081AA|nr:SRPBCC domain-containing protein [Rhizohabitans arisaemae]
MIDVVGEINAISREVGSKEIPAGAGRTTVLRREYKASMEDVWDAITDPERIVRWFLPVKGDLKVGGKYQLEGNAGGEILRCEAPRLLKLTWVFGENTTEKDISEVEVRLSPGPDGRTLFELEHAAVVNPEWWARYGPGAAGVGWDLSLLGLGLYLAGGTIEDPREWEVSEEARRFATLSSQAWGAAMLAGGGTEEEVAVAVRNTTDFYAPPPENG